MNDQPVDIMGDIKEFHQKFHLSYTQLPRVLPPEIGPFRADFMQEELDEYNDARLIAEEELKLAQPDMARVAHQLEHMLDAIVDLIYVAAGTGYLQGFDFDEAWRRVHAKNLMKVRVGRVEDSKRGSTFDVVKPEGWTAPCHADLVRDHAHRQGEL